MKSRVGTYLLQVAGVTITYFLSARLGQWLTLSSAEPGVSVAVFWPAPGVALAALLLFGLRVWPGILLGAALAMVRPAPVALLAVGLGKTLAAVVGALLLRRARFRPQLDHSREVLKFVGLGAVVGPMLSSTISVTVHGLTGQLSWETYGMHWAIRTIGDVLGILVVAPLLLILAQADWRAWEKSRRLEGVVWFLALVLGANLVFRDTFITPLHDFPYFTFVIVLAIILRLGQVGGVVATAVVTLLTAWGTATGQGPFAHDAFFYQLGSSFIFIGLLASTTLILAAVICERTQAEQALRQSERTLRSLFAALKDVILVFDAEGRCLEAAPTKAMIAYDEIAYFPGKTLSEITTPEKAAELQGYLQRALQTQQVVEVEYSFPFQGADRWIAATISPNPNQTVTWVAHDFTDRKRALEQVRFQARLLEVVEQAIIASDLQGVVVYWNQFAEKLYGWSAAEVLGKALTEFLPREKIERQDKERFRQCQAGASWSGESVWPTKSGHVIPVWASAVPFQDEQGKLVGILSVSVDLTERKHLEEELRQSQKMEAVGKLAGGIAHDFNNLLTAINGYSHLLLNQLDENDGRRARVGEIKKAGERAADLTQQLLAFSRKQILQPKVIDLNAAIREMEQLLKTSAGEGIALQLQLALQPCQIKADPGQIAQVILNLIVNARDAMPQGGTLCVETMPVYLNASQAQQRGLETTGNYVKLVVSDTGQGIDETTKARIFEPFFTTKEQGKGTGLGLATVYGIMRQSNGAIQVESKVGIGTTFSLYLPLAEEVALPITEAPAVYTPVSETILLVEDEEQVRILATTLLQEHGYQVLTAKDGAAAQELCRSHAGNIDLLLTDVIMPQMNGYDLAAQALALRPALKVVYMSGYVDPAVIPPAAGTVVRKPFQLDELLQKIREALNTEGHASQTAAS